MTAVASRFDVGPMRIAFWHHEIHGPVSLVDLWNGTHGLAGSVGRLRILFELARRGHHVTLCGNVTAGDCRDVVARPGMPADGADVLVLNNPPDEAGWHRVSGSLRCPMVLWAGNPVDQRWLDRAHARALAAIVCVSQFHRELYRTRSGFESIEVIYSGVDLDLMDGASPNPEARGAVVFCSVPRRTKGFQHLLRAWPLVRERIPDTCLRVIGSARMHDPSAEVGRTGVLDRDLEEEFPKFFSQPPKSLEQAGITLIGPISTTQVFSEMKAAAVVAVNCNWRGGLETYCRAAVEAQAAGTAVIGAARGSLPEVVSDGVTGLLVPKDDSRLLAHSIVRLLEDRALRERLGAAGPAWVRRFTDPTCLGDNWEVVIRRALNGQKPTIPARYAIDMVRRLGYGHLRASVRNCIRGTGLERVLLRYVSR